MQIMKFGMELGGPLVHDYVVMFNMFGCLCKITIVGSNMCMILKLGGCLFHEYKCMHGA